MKAWKLDLWITLAALLVSGLTASAALFQSKVFSDQLSATVWPYLSFDGTLTNGGRTHPSSFRLMLTNDGAGPAIIEGAEIRVAGKRVATLAAAFQAISKFRPRGGFTAYTFSSINRGEVIRPGASAQVVQLAASRYSPSFQTGYNEIAMNVYYCSLLNACWVVHLHSTDRPEAIDIRAIPRTGIQPN